MADKLDTDVLRLATKIVAAHKGKNQVAAGALAELIQSVYRSLAKAGTAEPAPALAPLMPAVPIRKSMFPDHIVCLEDGQKLKTLKRHLQASHGMTPEQYRNRWGLPDSYPMVAPDYASHRSRISKQIGFSQEAGNKRTWRRRVRSRTCLLGPRSRRCGHDARVGPGVKPLPYFRSYLLMRSKPLKNLRIVPNQKS